MRKSFLFGLFIFISCIAFQNINAQLSKKHYLPPITSDEAIDNQYIYISTPKSSNVSFTIKPIGKPASEEITGTVSNATPFFTTSTIVGTQLFQEPGQTATIINDKGYIIEANDVIYVSVRMISAGRANQASAIVSKGLSALGTEFRMGGFPSTNPANGHLNFVSVMATEDNTNVTFDDFTPGININNYEGPIPFTKTLNEGESFIVSVSFDRGGTPSDLLGTLIKSDDENKPIVVNSGSATGTFDTPTNLRDYGIDQIVDAKKIGDEYIFVKGDGENAWENILIVAHHDNTEVFINDNLTAETTIAKAGEWYVIEGNEYSTNGNMYVKTSQPVFAYQGVGANDRAANQGLFFVPPLNCESTGFVDNIPNIDKIGFNTFEGGVSIVTKKGATLIIEENSTNTNHTIDGPKDILGNSNYVTYKVTNLSGNVTVKSLIGDAATELYCSYFNQNGAATSGGFYSGFPSKPEINFNVNIETLGNCLGNNLKLEAANTELFDGGIQWQLYNETTLNWVTKSTENAYTPLPTEPGRYRLVGKVICTGTEFISVEIPISICPDDYDKDGIIDNVDVDIDNDGILNCDESLGDKIIDLSDINTPTVTDDLTTINANLITENTTFTGDATGSFTSVANASGTSNSTYSLDFNDNINFKLTQNSTKDHTISDNEYFILRLSQADKNITLLDPDNQILVDSNFDDEFEDDFTQFSASVIKFKFKTDLVGGTSTFQFVANQIKNISFEHNNNISSDISTFNGTIGLTCFTLDSDGDGIENMFDLDSDNDGIPDISEVSSPQITLLKTDANLDGLDDAFNGLITNIDTDNDGVKNYLDYDTDNDGIFDSTEANHGLDVNFNGTVDTFIDINKNGLADSLENDTTVQTLSLKYTIADTDGDNVFNFLELDADNDGCNDVIEAGFTEYNNDGILFANSFSVDKNGKVKNPDDGYTNPNSDYITSAPIELITPFTDVTFCESATDTITIDATANGFQWELSTDDGATWNTITDNAVYLGSNTNSLQITNTPYSYNNYQYRVALTRTGNSCGLTSAPITLTVNPKPIILNNPAALFQCDTNSDLQTTFNLTEAEISISTDADHTFKYYKTKMDAENGVQEVNDKTSYFVAVNGEAWVRTTSTATTCHTISKINLTVSYTPNQTFEDTFYQCDDFLDAEGNNTVNNSDTDGITFFDLSSVPDKITTDTNKRVEFYETDEDRTKSINQITETQSLSNYRNTNHPYLGSAIAIYYKIIDKTNNNCQGIGEFNLEVNKIPEFSVKGETPDAPIIICAKNVPYTLEIQSLFKDDYDYKWTDKVGNTVGGNSPTLSVSDQGEYTVTASSRETTICSRTRTIVVLKSNFENLENSFVTVTDDISGFSANLSIRIDIPTNPLINEEFQYALENENGNIVRPFQDDNIFNNVEGGVYKIIVENKDGCGTSSLIVSVIQFPKFFTPNGQQNKTWTIKGTNSSFYQPNSTINIFNRYGKLVAQTSVDGEGWDGTYSGKTLPSDDYWFTVQLIPIDPNKMPILKKGHFSLLRQ
ncbi:T9SS type B sorting domain-containing protein [Polaribacter sp. L3A8]|uniref:T9SS type B sorting domain-containing protein n=1 Tax=Polaribacter sp. L3A8 TaxID=2686361 RepID=UPI00131B4778|nr:T9SS type B sorting domain-containing protein [Polaribacter sp. L3A8]